MLNPTVHVHQDSSGVLIAEFWDCLRLDPAPVQDLRRQYETHVLRKGRPDLIVDFNGVEFAGSAALGGFVTLQKKCRQSNGRLVFCHVEPNVLEVFRVSKLEPLFTFVPSVKAGLEWLANSQDGPQGNGRPNDPAATPAAASPESAPRTIPPLRSRRRKD